TEGAFRAWGYEVAQDEFGDRTIPWEDAVRKYDGKVPADTILIKDVIADNMFQQLLLRPEEYDVLATTNLNGDYLSDAAAAQIGGDGAREAEVSAQALGDRLRRDGPPETPARTPGPPVPRSERGRRRGKVLARNRRPARTHPVPRRTGGRHIAARDPTADRIPRSALSRDRPCNRRPGRQSSEGAT